MKTIKELEADEKFFEERKWDTLKWRAKDKIEALKDVLGFIDTLKQGVVTTKGKKTLVVDYDMLVRGIKG